MVRLSQESQDSIAQLLQVGPPIAPSDFAEYWSRRFDKALQIDPRPVLTLSPKQGLTDFEQFDVTYCSTGGVRITGWLTVPRLLAVRRAIVIGHGYGSCPEPTDSVPLKDAAYLWPCLRGLNRSQIPGVPQDPHHHVIYDIDKPERYIIGGCVEDLWLAVTALEKIFPAAKKRVGMMGNSFSGGIGMLATPWDERLCLIHLQVPTFGHHPLRMTIPSHGSAKSLQDFYQQHPDVLCTLAYFDAANSAQFMQYTRSRGPSQVRLVHGESRSLLALEKQLRQMGFVTCSAFDIRTCPKTHKPAQLCHFIMQAKMRTR